MKVVINISPDGLFKISNKGLVWLHSKGAAVATPAKDIFGNLTRDGDLGYPRCLASYKDHKEWKFAPHGYVFSEDDLSVLNADGISRHDANLVLLVENLLEEASGYGVDLQIIEIPDGTNYSIEIDADGVEFIAEEHATWRTPME